MDFEPGSSEEEKHQENYNEEEPGQFLGIINMESEEVAGNDEINDLSEDTKNPNKDDPRRLFQVYKPVSLWDCNIPYSEQSNLLENNGPVPLLFPDHFYDVEGGISVIIWEKDRSTSCLCCILSIDEEAEKFVYQCFNYQGKKK